MAQALLKSDSFNLFNYGRDIANLVDTIKNYINEHDCPKLSMDISHLNIIEASKVTVLCSTHHWAKYPEGKISWKINSPEINELIEPLNLGNISLIAQ